MTEHAVISHEAWQEARKALLIKEKAFTRLRDELTRERQEMPWEAVTKEYRFEGPDGSRTLGELFAGRSQLVVYHAMFAPESEAACKICSFWIDNFQGALPHLRARDVTLVAISRAPYAKLAAYSARLGWTHPWYSSGQNAFNRDFAVQFTPEEVKAHDGFYNYDRQEPVFADREGVSVFYKDANGKVFHTYSAYARGIDLLNAAYNYLDLVPKGRDEDDRGAMWVKRHDEYGATP